MENIQTKCLNLLDIERLVANESLLGDKKSFIKTHLAACHKCQRKYGELKTFYQNLKQEMLKPISQNVFALARQIEDDILDAFYFILKPHLNSESQKDSGTNLFIISKIENQEDSLVNLYRSGAIILRALVKKSTQKACLTIWAEDKKYYQNVKYYCREKDKLFMSNEVGLIRAGRIDPKELDGQIVQLSSV